MRIAVCDDEKYFRNVIIELLDKYSEAHKLIFDISEFNDGKHLAADKNTYDMIFLDHQMNDLNGLDTIKLLREKNKDTKVVFVSSYSDIVFDSMKYNAFRFLVKPVKKEKLFEALDSALDDLNSVNKVIAKDMKYNENVVIPEKDIIYAQADNIYAYIVTAEGTYRYINNISALEEELRSDYFFRSNRSYIVNLNYVNSYDKNEITLSNGQKAVLSKSKYKDFNSCYLSYIKRSYME